MELTIRTDGADVMGSLRAALGDAGNFELIEAGETAVGVVAGSRDAQALAAALGVWLRRQPPGSELTVETSTQVLTVHAGDPRASIALTEAVTREGRAAEQGVATSRSGDDANASPESGGGERERDSRDEPGPPRP